MFLCLIARRETQKGLFDGGAVTIGGWRWGGGGGGGLPPEREILLRKGGKMNTDILTSLQNSSGGVGYF